jgi:hypothetical protein
MKSDLDHALNHKYRVEPGGEFVPGVTTVINIMDKPALKWSSSGIAARTAVENSRRKKVIVTQHREWLKHRRKYELSEDTDDEVFIHYCRGQFDREWKAKADRGTRVHDIAERWTRGEEVEVEKGDEGFVDALENFHKTQRPNFLLAECVVANPQLKYGGRFDAIVELDGDEFGTYLIDYKTGGHYPLPVAMQSVAYMNAKLVDWEMDGTLGSFSNLPKLDGARIVYLSQDGSFSVVDPFQTVDKDLAWEAFQSALNLYRVTQQIERNGNAK